MSVAIAVESKSYAETRADLVTNLALPIVHVDDDSYDFLLVFTETHLELRQPKVARSRPLFIDFLSGKYAHRRLFGGGRNQLLAKAIGIKKKEMLSVLDATAGLGNDGFVMAWLGCRVHFLERSPIIGALLDDALRRAKSDASCEALQMSFSQEEASHFMKSHDAFDVVYLDPMFPERKKSALVKREMRILREIVGEDPDAPALLQAALQFAKRRVVVKRSRLAPPILGPKPSFSFEGKRSRFDVYLIQSP